MGVHRSNANEMTKNVLILCTGNSARSILAECTLNHLSVGRFRAFSAGSKPTGRVNPFAIELLQREGIATDGVRSKSWDEFARADSPPLDIVITVCASAAGETCPVFIAPPGQAVVRTHWGVDDPAAVEGSDVAKRAAFRAAYTTLRRRIEALLALPERELSAARIKPALDSIGTLL